MFYLPLEIWTIHIGSFLEAKDFYWIRLFIGNGYTSIAKLEQCVRSIGRYLKNNLNENINTIDYNIFILLHHQYNIHCYEIELLNSCITKGLFAKVFNICKKRRIKKTILMDLEPLLHLNTLKMASLILMHRYLTQSRRSNSLNVVKYLLQHPLIVRID